MSSVAMDRINALRSGMKVPQAHNAPDNTYAMNAYYKNSEKTKGRATSDSYKRMLDSQVTDYPEGIGDEMHMSLTDRPKTYSTGAQRDPMTGRTWHIKNESPHNPIPRFMRKKSTYNPYLSQYGPIERGY